MSHLALYLLGPPRVERDGVALKFRYRKHLALLAYLALAGPGPGGESHTRESLITLLWPELEPSRARAILRRDLSLLRKALGREWLVADRETVGLDPDATPWVDVDQFRQRLAACKTHAHPPTEACRECISLLEEAAELYRGDFLAGFTLRDSAAFDEFQFFQTEGLKDQLAGALVRLATYHTSQGDFESAISHARRWQALDPLHEPAHQHLMRLYAQAGQRAAALRQYRTCMRTLEEELGVPPSAETTALYKRIRTERARPAEEQAIAPTSTPQSDTTFQLPTFCSAEEEPVTVERPVFVVRERELARLDSYLEAALAGQGQVVFVTGGPGRGKTALMHEFARRAMTTQPDLLIADGHCNAYFGVGDPYLPFCEVLGMLTGDVEARWAAGTISREHAQRLWSALPHAAQALVDRGPSLIGTLVPIAALLSRAARVAPRDADWLQKLKAFSEGERSGHSGLEQSAMFEQYANVLRVLAAQFPLLLVVDDMQWADAASTGLLFHLGRRLERARVLIVGAYRPEEVSLGRDGERHPLQKVLAEFKRSFGDAWVDLTQADGTEGRRFVDAFLDIEANRLGEVFREALFLHTGGHPLFTIEVLRAMQERGDLVQDEERRWTEEPALDWDILPTRVEAVIAERVGRLDEELHDILAVASVEGERFTAQVVAQVQDMSGREVLRALFQELCTRHRLVREGDETQVGQRLLSHYQFAHALFQQHLYNGLTTGERRLLHGEIAAALEALYGDQTQEIAAQLAHHYAEAGHTEKAIQYSLRAGDQARLAYAHEEAIDHYQRVLVSLKKQGKHEQVARTLMKLGSAYDLAFDFRQARQAYKEGLAMWQLVGEIQKEDLPPAPHAFRLCGEEPLTLDPTRAINKNSIRVIAQLFSGLVDVGLDKEVVPDVAQSWEMLEGGRKFLFHLRDDVHWSDGTPVTAGDFEYAWKRVLDPALGLHIGRVLYDIKGARAFHQGEVSSPDSVGVRALDEVTLVVEMEGPTSYSLYLLADTAAYPVPRHVVETHGEAWTEVGASSAELGIVTNGPFRLKSWQRGKSLVLVRSPQYHGRFRGNLQRVEQHIWSCDWEWPIALAMYEADSLDILGFGFLAGRGTSAQRDDARQRHAGEYVSLPISGTFCVGFRVGRPPFDDVRVRRAFVLAADRETLVDKIMGSYAAPATGGLIPPGIPGHSPGIGLPYDPDQARQLLAQAGYPSGRGFPGVDALISRGSVQWIECLQTQWRENLGIEIHWEAVDVVTLEDKLPTEEFDLFFDGSLGGVDPDGFSRECQSLYDAQYQNDAYYRLVEEARRVIDQKERMQLYGQADRLLMEDAAIVPLYYFHLPLLVKPWITSTAAIERWSLKDIIIEPH